MKRAVGVALLLFVANACGSKSPSAPSTPDLSGTWRGTARSSTFGGAVNITTTLAQSGASVTGTYACTPGTIDCLHASGTINGTVSGNSVTLQVAFPGGGSCGAPGATVSGNTLTGSYSCIDPSGTDQGTLTLTKQ